MPKFFIPEQMSRLRTIVPGTVVSVAALWGLICLYGEVGAGASFGTAAVGVAVLLAGAWVWGFASAFLVSPAGRIVVALMIAAAGIGIVWGITALLGWYPPERFPRLIPLLVVCGGASRVGLWLRPALPRTGDRMLRQPEPDSPAPPEKHDAVDRISVKKGSEIHIVRIDDLLYVLAEGDYVWLFTPAGRFLKEQTMRWFEEHLPDRFVRIHRSCIVDIDQIARVELFGKENYHVRLKNGAVLKASLNGYRALKFRLDL